MKPCLPCAQTRVCQDICASLNMRDVALFSQSFNRPNLRCAGRDVCIVGSSSTHTATPPGMKFEKRQRKRWRKLRTSYVATPRTLVRPTSCSFRYVLSQSLVPQHQALFTACRGASANKCRRSCGRYSTIAASASVLRFTTRAWRMWNKESATTVPGATIVPRYATCCCPLPMDDTQVGL